MAKTKSRKLRQRSKAVTSSTPQAQSFTEESGAGDISNILQQLHEAKFDADFDARSVVTSKSLHGLNLKKKDKRKLRHTVWTKKVGAIEAQIKEAKARKKRAAVPVIGDMSQLMESLPTFDLLLDRATVQSRLHRQKNEKRKERSVETESVRKQQRLADISLFKSVLVHPTFESSSASTIVEHLRTRLQRDDTL